VHEAGSLERGGVYILMCAPPRSFVPDSAAMHRLLALFAALTLTACATGGTGNPFTGGTSGGGGDAAATSETFRVRAMNPSFMDVTIFAVNAYTQGQRVRIGRLGSSQERAFDFRMSSATREVRFQLEYFTGPTCVTGIVSLVPGDVVELILPAEPRNELGCR